MIALAVAWLTVAAGAPPAGTTLYSSQVSGPAGTATIVQSGPKGIKPIDRKKVGPGYSILHQESGGNSTTIMQLRSDE
jgi:hypothetical protein